MKRRRRSLEHGYGHGDWPVLGPLCYIAGPGRIYLYLYLKQWKDTGKAPAWGHLYCSIARTRAQLRSYHRTGPSPRGSLGAATLFWREREFHGVVVDLWVQQICNCSSEKLYALLLCKPMCKPTEMSLCSPHSDAKLPGFFSGSGLCPRYAIPNPESILALLKLKKKKKQTDVTTSLRKGNMKINSEGVNTEEGWDLGPTSGFACVSWQSYPKLWWCVTPRHCRRWDISFGGADCTTRVRASKIIHGRVASEHLWRWSLKPKHRFNWLLWSVWQVSNNWPVLLRAWIQVAALS